MTAPVEATISEKTYRRVATLAAALLAPDSSPGWILDGLAEIGALFGADHAFLLPAEPAPPWLPTGLEWPASTEMDSPFPRGAAAKLAWSLVRDGNVALVEGDSRVGPLAESGSPAMSGDTPVTVVVPLRAAAPGQACLGLTWGDGAAAPTPAAESLLRLLGQAIAAQLDRALAVRQQQLSQERLEIIATVAADYVYTAAILPDGSRQIEWMHGSLREITGYRLDEMPADWFSLVHPEDLAMVRAANLTILANERIDIEYRLRARDGSWRWLRAINEPIWDAGQGRVVRVVGVARDVTDRRQIERAMRQTERLFQTLADQSPNMLFMATEGRLEYANRHLCESLGYQAAELLAPGFELLRCFAAEDREKLLDAVRALEQGEPTVEFDATLLTREGQPISSLLITRLLDYGERRTVLGIAVDITARIAAEEAVRQSEAHLRSLMTSAHSFAVYRLVSDPARPYQASVVFASPSVREIMGLEDPNDFSTWFANIHPADRSAVVAAQMESAASGVPFQEEMRIWHLPTQEWRWIHASSSPVLDKADGKLYYNGLIVDISSRKRVEASLQRLNIELELRVQERTAAVERANRELRQMAAVKDAFLANVSHELRTPLANLKLYHDLIGRGHDRLDAYLGTLNRETSRLNQIVEDLIEVSTLGKAEHDLKHVPVNVAEMVGAFVDDRRAMAADVGLEINYEPVAAGLIAGDPNMLERVVNILFTNAVNYTEAGGTITVRIDALEVNARPGCTLSVQDTGLGITPADQARLFERFFRGEAARQRGVSGTGIGLAIAREIVRRHGGHIDVASAGIPGRGTTFTVWLPAD